MGGKEGRLQNLQEVTVGRWHYLTLSPEAAVLDGRAFPLDPPLRAEEFAQEWATLWLAANPDPNRPDEEIRQAQKTVTAGWLEELGRRLFERAIPPEAARVLAADTAPLALGFSSTEGRLSLSDLPWELLNDGRGFLSRRRGMVRLLEVGGRLPDIPLREGPLEVLVAMASPAWNPDLPPYDRAQPVIIRLDREADLFRSLGGEPFPVRFHLRFHVTPSELDEALGGRDVLHFVGHGNVGFLVLENRDGTCHKVDVNWLRERFSLYPLRLVLFTSCLTGAGPAGIAGVAQTLLEAGVPIVLAMFQAISDRAGRAFYRRLYAGLKDGEPLYQALASARRAVVDEEGIPPWEWATPVLFARPKALELPLWTFPSGPGPAEVMEPPRPALPPLVPRPEPFVGRREERVLLARYLDPQDGVPLTVVRGEGGMGKSALAAEMMHRLAGRFSFILWLSARDVLPADYLRRHLADSGGLAGPPPEVGEQPADARFFHALARALGVPDVHGDEPAESLLQPILRRLEEKAAAPRPPLLILDNLETVAVSLPVQNLLRSLPRRVRCLVTSRHALPAVEAPEVPLQGLYPEEVGELLTRYAGVHGVVIRSEEATELYRRAGGHPFTLRLAVAQVQKGAMTWEEALQGLRDARSETWKEAFDYIFRRSLEAAGEEGRRALALLSLFSPLARREVWAAATGWEETRFGRAAARLYDLSLVEATPDRALYRLQELARAQAEVLLGEVAAEEVAAAKHRAAQALNGWAGRWDALLSPSERRRQAAQAAARAAGRSVEEVERAGEEEALAGFEMEAENLVAAVEWADQAGDADLTVRLAGNLARFFGLRSRWPEGVRTHERALAAARRAGDRRGEGKTLTNLGTVYLQQGRWGEAVEKYQQALAILRALGDRQGEGQTLTGLGNVYLQQGRWGEAVACYEQALPIFRALGDRRGEGQTLNNLGIVYRLQGRWEEAVEKYQEALPIFRALGDRYGEGLTLTNLGNVYLQQGRWGEAVEKYQEALPIFRDLGDRRGEGQTLTNLGLVYADQGRWEEAVACYEQALPIFRALGDRYGEGLTLTNLGNVYLQQGRREEALEALREARRRLEEVGDAPNLVICFRLLAAVHQARGEGGEAVSALAAALGLALQVHPKPAAETLDEIVKAAREWGEQGEWPAVRALGAGVFQMVEEMSRRGVIREEMAPWAALAAGLSLAIVGAAARRLGEEVDPAGLRDLARGIDQATGGRWRLEEWVGG